MKKRPRDTQSNKKENTVQLPAQLASLIRGEAASLLEADPREEKEEASLNQVVAASQSRHVKVRLSVHAYS